MTSTNNKLVVCERCGFIALLADTRGWTMATTEKGLCPACVRDLEDLPAAPEPRVKVASRRDH